MDVVYDQAFRNRVLATLEQPPPSGQAVWDGPAVAKRVNASVHAVWRVLRKEGVCLQRQRSWCVSTDKQFAAKAADIIALYLNPPEKALVISVDEKPSIQALERATGYVETDNGKIVRGCKSTYKRHGTLNLFAALQVATGARLLDNPRSSRRSSCMPHLLQRYFPLLVVLLFAGCATQTTPPSTSDELQARLIGTWLLERAAVPGNPSGIGLRRMLFTTSNWEIEQRNPAPGAIVFRHGGTYRLQGDIMESTVTFAEQSTANRIGVVSNSKIKVEGDLFSKVGLDNPFTETWRRVPASKLPK